MLTSRQIHSYYDRIALPDAYRLDIGPRSAETARDPRAGLEFLTLLQRHHLANIPFESLSLHYSTHHSIPTDVDSLYCKIVGPLREREHGPEYGDEEEDGRRGCGRGGYCMESNGLFGHVLRSLGFDVYQTGARVNAAAGGRTPKFGPWDHMLNIVTFTGGGKVYVDVGFGSQGPTRPIPLSELSSNPVPNLPSQSMRLIHDNIPENANRDQRLWIYEVKHGEVGDDSFPWMPFYCFSDVEFIPADFESMNFYASQSRTSWFTWTVVCVKFLFGEEGSGDERELVGTLTMAGKVVKRKLYGKTDVVAEMNTEEQRVRALEFWFGLRLSDAEKEGIKGTSSELVE